MFSPSFIFAIGVCNIHLSVSDRKIISADDYAFLQVFFGLIVSVAPKWFVGLGILASINLNRFFEIFIVLDISISSLAYIVRNGIHLNFRGKRLMCIRWAFLNKRTLFTRTGGLPNILFSAWSILFFFCLFMFLGRLQHFFHLSWLFWLDVATIIQTIKKFVCVLQIRMILFLLIFVFDQLCINLFVKDLQLFVAEFLFHCLKAIHLKLENQHAFLVLAAGELKFFSLVTVQD